MSGGTRTPLAGPAGIVVNEDKPTVETISFTHNVHLPEKASRQAFRKEVVEKDIGSRAAMFKLHLMINSRPGIAT